MSSETSDNVSSSDFENRIKRFRDQSQDYCNSLLNQRFLSSDKVNQKITNHYLTEYQRCVDEENRFESYLREQINTLESLKSCESTIDLFLQRLRNITEYEMKQNEVFEQILHELTKMVRFLVQINFLLIFVFSYLVSRILRAKKNDSNYLLNSIS